jgi:hypothetical protein
LEQTWITRFELIRSIHQYAEEVMTWRGDEDDIRVKKEDLVRAIEKLMNGEDERGC